MQTLTDPWEVDGVWLLRDLEGIRLEGWWQGVWSRGTDAEYKGIYFLQVLSEGHQSQRHLQQLGGPDGLPVTVSQPFPTSPWLSTSKMAMVKMKVGQLPGLSLTKLICQLAMGSACQELTVPSVRYGVIPWGVRNKILSAIAVNRGCNSHQRLQPPHTAEGTQDGHKECRPAI